MPPLPIAAFITMAPDLAVAGLKVFEKIRNMRKPPGDAEGVDIHDLQAAVTNILAQLDVVKERFQVADERFEALADAAESQAELIVRLTNHSATLARWLLFLATVSVISSGVAIAALVLAIL